MTIAPRFPIPDTRVVSRVPEILRLCTNKKVLHLGCSDMPHTLDRGETLLHKQLAKHLGAENLWGVDVSEEGVRLLHEMGFTQVVCGDVTKMGTELREEAFDIVVAGEIIEHVPNLGRFLHSVRNIMDKKTELVITTPNAFGFKGFLHSMTRREKVHEDHICYFSYRTLKQLLEKYKLSCKEIYYYQEIGGQGVARMLEKVILLVTKISPVWADGLIVRAVRG